MIDLEVAKALVERWQTMVVGLRGGDDVTDYVDGCAEGLDRARVELKGLIEVVEGAAAMDGES